MRLLTPFILLISSALSLQGQRTSLTAIHERSDETISYLLFEEGNSDFSKHDAWVARTYDLALNHPDLSVSGDFTGDGIDELAVFNSLEYTPNMNPAFTSSVVSLSRSAGSEFIPSGTWFSTPENLLDFDYVSFTMSDDYNGDGYDDIALFYNDPSSDQLSIYLMKSTGSGFSDAQSWYSVNRNEFNFTAIKFACPGDFNGNGMPDMAVFYNYFGTTPGTTQSIFLFESQGDAFSLLPAAYQATKADYDFSNMKFALAGDYNLDGYSDMAVLLDDSLNNQLSIPVFEGDAAGQLTPVVYNTLPETELVIPDLLFAASGDFAGDSALDLALFYDNQVTGRQEILLMECDAASFNAPETAFSTDLGTLAMADITVVRSGTFIHQPLVTAATWKGDMQGAVSFTFDDGYRGAFEHGGAELAAAGLKGTFYIFTDTTTIYDGELASTSLVGEYKEMGHEIGSHTANHSNLGFLTEAGDTDSMEQVLSSSVELLNERFDQQTTSMSIPFGSFRYETLEYISRYFNSARSSQFGFNLATPYDFYALKSWPILSTTSPAYVDNLLSTAETFGTYLPLMYHDMVDEPFDEAAEIYNYSRDLFRETLELAGNRDLWIDTHDRVYKYIRERNALKITQVYLTGEESDADRFSFIADDHLADSLFNVELTLKIYLPDSWLEDMITIKNGDGQHILEADRSEDVAFVLFDHLPNANHVVQVFEGDVTGIGDRDRTSELDDVAMMASPNPFLHETLVTVPLNNLTSSYLVIRDLHGRVVQEIREHTGGSYRVLRENLPSGIYVIQLVESGRQLASLKILAL